MQWASPRRLSGGRAGDGRWRAIEVKSGRAKRAKTRRSRARRSVSRRLGGARVCGQRSLSAHVAVGGQRFEATLGASIQIVVGQQRGDCGVCERSHTRRQLVGPRTFEANALHEQLRTRASTALHGHRVIAVDRLLVDLQLCALPQKDAKPRRPRFRSDASRNARANGSDSS